MRRQAAINERVRDGVAVSVGIDFLTRKIHELMKVLQYGLNATLLLTTRAQETSTRRTPTVYTVDEVSATATRAATHASRVQFAGNFTSARFNASRFIDAVLDLGYFVDKVRLFEYESFTR